MPSIGDCTIAALIELLEQEPLWLSIIHDLSAMKLSFLVFLRILLRIRKLNLFTKIGKIDRYSELA